MWGPFREFFCKWHSRRIIKGSPEPNAGGEKPHGCCTNHLMNTDDPSRKGIIHFLQAFHWPWKEKPNRNQAHSRSFPERLESDLYAYALLCVHITGKYSGIHARWFLVLAACGSSKQLMPEKKHSFYFPWFNGNWLWQPGQALACILSMFILSGCFSLWEPQWLNEPFSLITASGVGWVLFLVLSTDAYSERKTFKQTLCN